LWVCSKVKSLVTLYFDPFLHALHRKAGAFWRRTGPTKVAYWSENVRVVDLIPGLRWWRSGKMVWRTICLRRSGANRGGEDVKDGELNGALDVERTARSKWKGGGRVAKYGKCRVFIWSCLFPRLLTFLATHPNHVINISLVLQLGSGSNQRLAK
jgi:hypothetical protein